MKTEDLAEVFQGLLRGMGSAMREKERAEIGALIDLFRRLPSQSVSDFIGMVDETSRRPVVAEVPVVARLQRAKEHPEEDRASLFVILQAMPILELKNTILAIGLRPGRSRAKHLQIVTRYLNDQQEIEPIASKPATSDVETLLGQYEEIKKQLKDLTVETIRTRCSLFARFSKPTISTALIRLGYPVYGTKDEMAARLQDNLISLKLNYELSRQS